MRRLVAVLIATVLTLMLAVPAAAGGRPEKFRLDPVTLGPENFEGSCAFPVLLVDTFASSNGFLFPVDRNGNQREVYTGGYRSTLTNLTSGKTIDITYFGRVEYVWRTDGTASLKTSGGVLYWIGEEDPNDPLGVGLWLMQGSLRGTIDAETFLYTDPARFNGRVIDLCAALS